MNDIKKFILIFAIFLATFTDAKEIFPFYPEISSREFYYNSPTYRYVSAFGMEVISESLKNHGITMVHRNFFDRISHREEIGFIGYHGSTQYFRMYQDIIRVILEELVGIPIREDFHFFRIPGEDPYSYKNLQEWGFYNYDPARFLCMNYAIYGNHKNRFSSSYYYFTSNGSYQSIDYTAKLAWLFSRLGLDTTLIYPLFQIGQKHFGAENGVIYQIFDMSHYDPRKPYYQLADNHCISYGTTSIFSTVVQGYGPQTFPNQIRMLLSNTSTLNPYSSLVVRRYDKISSEVAQAYMEELRQAVRCLDYSLDKAELYKNELLHLWEDDEQ